MHRVEVSRPTPPWICTVLCPIRCPASAAQNLAVAIAVGADGSSCASSQSCLLGGYGQRLRVDVAVGQALRHGLERSDRTVELLAFTGIFGRQAERLGDDSSLLSATARRVRAMIASTAPGRDAVRFPTTPSKVTCAVGIRPVTGVSVMVTPSSAVPTSAATGPSGPIAVTSNKGCGRRVRGHSPWCRTG